MEYCYDIYKKEPNTDRAGAAVFLLAKMADSRVLQWIPEFMEDNNDNVRWNGMIAVGQILEGPLDDDGIALAKELLAKAEADSYDRLRERAAEIRKRLASDPRLSHLEL